MLNDYLVKLIICHFGLACRIFFTFICNVWQYTCISFGFTHIEFLALCMVGKQSLKPQVKLALDSQFFLVFYSSINWFSDLHHAGFIDFCATLYIMEVFFCLFPQGYNAVIGGLGQRMQPAISLVSEDQKLFICLLLPSISLTCSVSVFSLCKTPITLWDWSSNGCMYQYWRPVELNT